MWQQKMKGRGYWGRGTHPSFLQSPVPAGEDDGHIIPADTAASVEPSTLNTITGILVTSMAGEGEHHQSSGGTKQC